MTFTGRPRLLRRLGFVGKDAGRGSFFGTGELGPERVPVLRVERVEILKVAMDGRVPWPWG